MKLHSHQKLKITCMIENGFRMHLIIKFKSCPGIKMKSSQVEGLEPERAKCLLFSIALSTFWF